MAIQFCPARSGHPIYEIESSGLCLRLCNRRRFSPAGRRRPDGLEDIKALSRVHQGSGCLRPPRTVPPSRPRSERPSSPSDLRICQFARGFRATLYAQGSLQFYAYFGNGRLTLLPEFFIANHFELFHHLTYENDWMASIIGALLPVPYLRGPGGGAHRIPPAFLKSFP